MGHPNYHTPGRQWPSGQPVEVEVIDQDADPMLEKIVDGEKRKYPDPHRIGRLAWQRILADRKLTVRAAGDNAQDVQSLAERLTEMERTARAAEARASEAEAQLSQLEREGPAQSQKAQQEIGRLQGVVDKMATELDGAIARAKAAEAKATDLEAQVEQLTTPAVKSPEEVAKADESGTAAQPPKGKGKGKGGG